MEKVINAAKISIQFTIINITIILRILVAFAIIIGVIMITFVLATFAIIIEVIMIPNAIMVLFIVVAFIIKMIVFVEAATTHARKVGVPTLMSNAPATKRTIKNHKAKPRYKVITLLKKQCRK